MKSSAIVGGHTQGTNLFKGISWSFGGNLVSVLCSWGFLLVLVKMGTSTMVGQYGLAMAIVTPLMSLSSLQLRAIQSTDASQEFTFGDYMSTRILTLVVSFFILIGILAFDRQNAAITAIALVMFVRLAIGNICDIYYGLFQQHEWIDKIGQAQIWSNVLVLLSFGAGLIFTRSLMVGLVCSLATAAIPLFAHNIPNARRLASGHALRGGLSIVFNRVSFASLLRLGGPLGIVSLLISLNASVPRYVLARYVSPADLGVFIALAALLTAGVALCSSASLAIVPRLARMRALEDKPGFLRLLVRLELVSGVLMLVGIVAAYVIGPQVVLRLYSSEYADHRSAIVWLAAACGITLLGWFVGNAITVARRLDVQILTNGIALGFLYILCAFLVPRYGIAGAAAAIALSSLVAMSLNVIVLLSYLRSWIPSELTSPGTAESI